MIHLLGDPHRDRGTRSIRVTQKNASACRLAASSGQLRVPSGSRQGL